MWAQCWHFKLAMVSTATQRRFINQVSMTTPEILFLKFMAISPSTAKQVLYSCLFSRLSSAIRVVYCMTFFSQAWPVALQSPCLSDCLPLFSEHVFFFGSPWCSLYLAFYKNLSPDRRHFSKKCCFPVVPLGSYNVPSTCLLMPVFPCVFDSANNFDKGRE